MTEGNKIKLIEIIADSSLGGGPKHVLGLIKNIDKEKYDVYVLCPSGFLSAQAKFLNIPVFNIAMRSKFDLISIYKIKQAINGIRAKYDPFGPTIVHTHGPRAGLLGRLAAPVGVKKVHTEHIFDSSYHLKNPLNELIQRRILREQNSKSDLIIAVSSSVKKFLIKEKMAKPNKVVVIPNGIEISDIKYKKTSVKADTKAPVIGTIGNLNFQKGHSYLIEAMAEVIKKYPLATLEIIGEGEEGKILEDQIKKLGLERHISLLGYKTEIGKYLQHWSVYASSSISETFGIAVLEAMSEGVPVVATKVGGIVDIITNDKNGLLVASKNSHLLADRVIEILNRPALAAKLKREGRERAKDFAWSKVIKLLENSFTSILD